MKRSRYTIRYLAAAIAFATFILYIPALRNEFINWDDGAYVYANTHIRSFDGSFFTWAFFEFYHYNWHPLTWISHALDYELWGLNPLGHHLTNIILHAANTFLVVVCASRLLDAYRERSTQSGRSFLSDDRSLLTAAGIAGLLFGIHPLHVESVVWVAERKDLLCALFFLLSVMKYARYAAGQRTAIGSARKVLADHQYRAALGFFVLALMSKPMAVTLPVVLLILDWHPFGRIRSLRTFLAANLEKLPFLALSLISMIVTVLAQKSGGAMELMGIVPLSSRVLVAVHSLIAYLWKMIWPLNLIPYYPYPRRVSLLLPEYLGALVLVFVTTAACLLERRNGRNVWLSIWAYYLVMLAPVLGLIQVGAQAMADRYTYLPSIGPFLLLGLGGAWAWTRVKMVRMRGMLAGIAGLLALIVLVFLSFLTVRQTGYWRSDVDLWQSVIDREGPRVLLAYFERGEAFGRRGQYEKAIQDYSTVISLNVEEYSKVYVRRGLTYLKVGQKELAAADLEKACSLGDDFGCQALLLLGQRGS